MAGLRLAGPEKLPLGLPGDLPRGFGACAGVPSSGMSVTKPRSPRSGYGALWQVRARFGGP